MYTTQEASSSNHMEEPSEPPNSHFAPLNRPDRDLTSPLDDDTSNIYFWLDIRLPRHRHQGSDMARPGPLNEDSSGAGVIKFGFPKLIEELHGKELTTNNPWMNPYFKKSPRRKYRKQVRFSTTEINGSTVTLPYCRRKHPTISRGQLHASKCKNSAQETIEVLGEQAWINRVFILDTYMRNAQHSYSRRKTEETEDNDEGYYHGDEEELADIGVFDSVELTKYKSPHLHDSGPKSILKRPSRKADQGIGSAGSSVSSSVSSSASSGYSSNSSSVTSSLTSPPKLDLDHAHIFEEEDDDNALSTTTIKADSLQDINRTPICMFSSVENVPAVTKMASSHDIIKKEAVSLDKVKEECDEFVFDMIKAPQFSKSNSMPTFGSPKVSPKLRRLSSEQPSGKQKQKLPEHPSDCQLREFSSDSELDSDDVVFDISDLLDNLEQSSSSKTSNLSGNKYDHLRKPTQVNSSKNEDTSKIKNQKISAANLDYLREPVQIKNHSTIGRMMD